MPRIVSCCVEKVHSNTTLCFGQEEETLGNAGAEEMSTTRPNYHIRKSLLIGGVRAPYSTDLQELRVRKPLLGKFTEPMSYVVHRPAAPPPTEKLFFSDPLDEGQNRIESIESIEKRRGVKKTSSSWTRSGRARGSWVWCLVFGVCGWPRRGEARRGEATRPPCF